MAKYCFRYVMVMCLVLAFGTTAFAQPPAQGTGEGRMQGGMQEDGQKAAMKAEARKKKLAEALNLDAQAQAKIFPIIDKYHAQRSPLVKSMKDTIRQLRDSLTSSDDAKLSEIMANMEKTKKAIQQLNESEVAELKAVLSLRQQAQLLLFKMKFAKEAREMRKKRGQQTDR